jgi:hypothetical protein
MKIYILKILTLNEHATHYHIHVHQIRIDPNHFDVSTLEVEFR